MDVALELGGLEAVMINGLEALMLDELKVLVIRGCASGMGKQVIGL